MSPAPKYCRKCGQLMVVDKQVTSYDAETGKPIRGRTALLICNSGSDNWQHDTYNTVTMKYQEH